MTEHAIFGDPNGTYAKVIAHSVSPRGDELSSIEGQIWRPMLAELNTHRDFSRNSASSRAIPVAKQIEKIMEHPAGPLVWPTEKPGMQGGEVLAEKYGDDAHWVWYHLALDDAVSRARDLMEIGVHKSIINRLLEPFMWHRVIISSTRWDNFFNQRCSPLAQPEIRVFAEHVRDALAASEPSYVDYDEWHLPYVGDDPEALDALSGQVDHPAPWIPAAQVSAARTARVSYLTHEGLRSIEKDFDLYHGTEGRHGLISANPPHWSPLEHPATPSRIPTVLGNFDGWIQLRHHPMAKEPRPS